MSADRNLLFGILAVQNDFIDDSQLIAALHEWKRDPRRHLGEVLLQQNALSTDERAGINNLVELNLKKHANNAEQSIAKLPTPAHLRRSVNQALGADSPFDADVTVAQPTKPGESIRFTKESLHREGGLGAVYKAEDTELRRLIALKEIKPRWADDPVSKESFLKEAEITGKLEHPGIVPVYGLGVYADQRPYYAMRFVEGKELKETIEDFHKSKKAFDSVEFRSLLDSFIAACNAIAYAHSRGIIHRDIKPQNILIGPFGETLVVDWGLAKVVGRAESMDGNASLNIPTGSDSSRTIAGDIKGTPAYMAPEQARGALNEHGPSADIYGLGGTLYFILAGRHAFADQSDEPILNRVIQGRFPSPRAIHPHASKSLEAICLKAMAKEPADRYGDVRALADDVKRHMADEQIAAARDPFAVRAKRWARKHPGTVAALAASVLVGTFGLAGGLFFVNKERNRTEAQRLVAVDAQLKEAEERKRAEAARDAEAKEKRFAQAIAAFVQDDFLAMTSVEGQNRFGGKELGRETTLKQLLDRAAAKLAERKDLDPQIEAELNWIVGVNLRGVGDFGRSVPFLERAVQLRKSLLGNEDEKTLDTQNSLAVAYSSAGNIGRAVELGEETWKSRKAKLGPDHHDTLTSMANLASAYQSAGKLDLALQFYEATLKAQQTKLGPDHPACLTTANNLAFALEAAGKGDAALPIYEATLKAQQANVGADHPATLFTMSNLASAYEAAGKRDMAMPLYVSALAARRAKLGDDHPDTLTSANNLASAYLRVDKLDLALPLFESTLSAAKAKLGPDHLLTFSCTTNLAMGYKKAGAFAKAIPLFETSLKGSKARFGAEHPTTLSIANNLAAAYKSGGKLALALPLYEDTLKARKAKLGMEHPDTLTTMGDLALAYEATGKIDLALPLQEQAFKGMKAKLGPEHPDTLIVANNLANAYKTAGKLDLALPLMEEILRIRKAKLGPDHDDTLLNMNSLAAAYYAAGKLESALPLFEEALNARKAKVGPDHIDTINGASNLAMAYLTAGKIDQALPRLEESLKGRKAKLGPAHPETLNSMRALGAAYAKSNQADKAAAILGGYIEALRKQTSKEDPGFAGQLAQVSLDLLQCGQSAAAEPLLRESLSIREKVQPDVWNTFNTKSLLGASLFGQKKYMEAEPLLKAGFEGMKAREKAMPKEAATRIGEAVERLVQFYEATGNEAEAGAWKAKRAAEKK